MLGHLSIFPTRDLVDSDRVQVRLSRDTASCHASVDGRRGCSGGASAGAPPPDSRQTLPDEVRLHERLFWLLRALDLQRILQQLGYDLAGGALVL